MTGNGDARDRASSGRRLSQAKTIERQKAIAHAREVERLSWAATAAKVGMAEKEARESYRRYLSEIVPLLIAVPAEGKAAELLRDLEDIRQQQFQIAAAADSDSASVGALRDATKTVQLEFEIRRTLGLMPKLVGDAELRSLAGQIVEVLERNGVAAEVADEIEQLFHNDQEAG